MPEIQVRKDLADKAKALDINVEKLIHDKLDPAPDPVNPWKAATLLLGLVGFLFLVAGLNQTAPAPDRELADLNGKLTALNQKLTHTIERLTQERDTVQSAFHALASDSPEEIKVTWSEMIQTQFVEKGLINSRLDPNGSTLLLNAVKRGEASKVRYLLQVGADPNLATYAWQKGVLLSDEIGKTPLMWAIILEHDDIIRQLILCNRVDHSIKNRHHQTALSMLHRQIKDQPHRAKKLREHIAAMGL